jgi:hypothetical protein
MSSAIEILLNAAETANTITAKITVVSLIPREDDLFINIPVSGVLLLFLHLYKTQPIYLINIVNSSI